MSTIFYEETAIVNLVYWFVLMLFTHRYFGWL